MKIYSITEILEASDNILGRQKIKKNETSEYKKTSIVEPLILNNPVDIKPLTNNLVPNNKQSKMISTKNIKLNNVNKNFCLTYKSF